MKEEPVVTGPTTHTPKNCIIWTLSTLLFLTFCVFGANFFLTEKNENVNDAFSATDDDASIKNWEEWRNKGVHKITTDTDRADLIHSLDEHDEGISTLLHSQHGIVKKSLHEKHYERHLKRKRRKERFSLRQAQVRKMLTVTDAFKNNTKGLSR